MKLAKISVEKYRSISTRAAFDVSDYTVLVGANNEGKSNLLRACVLAMKVIEGWAERPDNDRRTAVPHRVLGIHDRPYAIRGQADVAFSWVRDHTTTSSGRESRRPTVIRLEFALDEKEQLELRNEFGIDTTPRLPIEITLRENDVDLRVRKQNGQALNNNTTEIARFISSRITLLYIPAVRDGRVATEIAESVLAEKTRQLLSTEKYLDLLREIENLESDAAEDVGRMLTDSLVRFVPNATAVKLAVRGARRRTMLSDVFINDGVETSLDSKGDGIQSLVAIALTLEWAQQVRQGERQLVLAVEEPESHLHPGAVHELRAILQELTETQQVLITTHSQGLVNRESLESNVIVGRGKVVPAKKLLDLRNALGVQLSDSLTAAEVMLIVEGDNDERVILPILGRFSPKIAKYVASGKLMIESANSGSKIYSRAASARSILTTPILLLDSDTAGQADAQKIISHGIADQTDIVVTRRPGFKVSEMEDLFLYDVYASALDEVLGFPLSDKQVNRLRKCRDAAWSERLEAILLETGVPDVKPVVKRAKRRVAEAVASASNATGPVLVPGCEPVFERLSAVIEQRIERGGSGGQA